VLCIVATKKQTHTFHQKQICIIISSTYILVVLRPYTMSTYFIRDGCRYHRNIIIKYYVNDHVEITLKKLKRSPEY
jgi:hypothetical protein